MPRALVRAARRALMSAALCLASNASGQRVALVRPTDPDPVLVDAYNRLKAELHLQHFDVLIVERDARHETRQKLADEARDADALAAISFVRRGSESTVDVWLVDRATGKTTMRTLQPQGASDASSVLAIRAADLLRASLREIETGRAPPDVAEVDRRPVPKAALAFIAPETDPWKLRVEALVLADGAALGKAYGASLGGFRQFGSSVALGAALATTFLGSHWSAKQGTATARHHFGWLEIRGVALRSGAFELGATALAGAHLLEAQGQAIPPWSSKSDTVWSVFAGAGLGGALHLGAETALALDLRALWLTPRPGVGIGYETTLVSTPLLQAAAGLLVGL